MYPWRKTLQKKLQMPPWTLLDNLGLPAAGNKPPEMQGVTRRRECPSFSLVDIEISATGSPLPTPQQSADPQSADPQQSADHQSADFIDHCPNCSPKTVTKRRQKPPNAYETHWGSQAPDILPTTHTFLPTLVDFLGCPPSKISSKMEPGGKKKEKNKKTAYRSFQAIVRFASSSLGKNISSYERNKTINTKRYTSPKPPCRGKRVKKTQSSYTGFQNEPIGFQSETYLARAHAKRDIKAQAQVQIRQSFEIAALQGAIKRPVIHVEFDAPQSLEECFKCSSMDFLYVYVGLCNVFLLQFIMVVILFFVDQEVNLSDLSTSKN